MSDATGDLYHAELQRIVEEIVAEKLGRHVQNLAQTTGKVPPVRLPAPGGSSDPGGGDRGGVVLSDDDPEGVGTAPDAGDNTTASRGDHVHALPTTGVTPDTYGDATHVPQITVDAYGRATAVSEVAITATGTVTSVALTMPSAIFDVAGSPITSSGTLVVTLDNQNANLVWAGPATGSPAAPTFRALVDADIPSGIGRASGASGRVAYYSGANTLTSDAGFTFDSGITTFQKGIYFKPGSTQWLSMTNWSDGVDYSFAIGASRILDPATGNYGYSGLGSGSQGSAIELFNNGTISFKNFNASDLTGTTVMQVVNNRVGIPGVALWLGSWTTAISAGDLGMSGSLYITSNGGSKSFIKIDDSTASGDIVIDLLNTGNNIGSGSYWLRARKSATDKFWVKGDGAGYFAGAVSGDSTIEAGGYLSSNLTDAATAATTELFRLNHHSSGTPGVGFGVDINIYADSASVASRTLVTDRITWATATDASRKARRTLFVYDTAAREALRMEASGSAPMLGLLGAAAVTRPNITGVRTGTLAQLQTAFANLLTGLANLGAITDSTT